MKTVFALAILATAVSASTFIFRNECPDEVTLYTGADKQPLANIRPGGVDEQRAIGSGYWTNLNGGQPTGENALQFVPNGPEGKANAPLAPTGVPKSSYPTDAEVKGYTPPAPTDVPKSSYYLIKPANKRLGVGITVRPLPETCPKDGECTKITCNAIDCNTAFEKKEDVSNAYKGPALPSYTCTGKDLTYLVTFCPGGKYATGFESRAIHPNGDKTKCLDVQGGAAKDGAKLVITECKESATQKWNVDKGITHVRVAGTNQCIEQPATKDSEVTLKTCGSGYAPQRWDFNDVGRIGGISGICLDVEGGVKTKACKSQEVAQSQIFTV